MLCPLCTYVFAIMQKILIGILFAALWGSGSVAIKLGISSTQPLLLINTRFLIAGVLMLLYARFVNRERLPNRNEWMPLIGCGILNMTIYSSVFVFAIKEITPGIGTLSAATCPLVISLLNAVWLRKKITWNIWAGLFIGLAGITTAIYPLLLNAHATPYGIFLLSLSVICYSVGTVYYQSIEWALPRLSINGWQVLFGGLGQLPFTLFAFEYSKNQYDVTFWLSLIWLIIPISIISVQLWLYLLKVEPIRASLWLFLCPIFGFFYAHFFMHEPITIFTIIGTICVIFGLYLGKKQV
jgi:probable blue pigment (indigoidine) exporter